MLCSREAGCGLEDTGQDPIGEVLYGCRAIQDTVKEAGIGDEVTGVKKSFWMSPRFSYSKSYLVRIKPLVKETLRIRSGRF